MKFQSWPWTCLGFPCLVFGSLVLLVLDMAWLYLVALVLVLAWLVLGCASASSVFVLVGTRRA